MGTARGGGLPCLVGVGLEDGPGFGEVELLAINDELVLAGVARYGMDVHDVVAVGAELLHDEVDVYHVCFRMLFLEQMASALQEGRLDS